MGSPGQLIALKIAKALLKEVETGESVENNYKNIIKTVDMISNFSKLNSIYNNFLRNIFYLGNIKRSYTMFCPSVLSTNLCKQTEN